MFRRFGYFSLILSLLSSSAFAWPWSQQEQPVSVSTISKKDIEKQKDFENTVYVYASRLNSVKLPQQKTSLNASVLSKKELQGAKPRTIQEAFQNQEGVVLYDAVGNGLDTTLSLRGFGESSAVTILVDGVRMNELDGGFVRFPLISVDDLERIQIERGSASPVYGSSALAGVVNITTGRPSKKKWKLFGGLDINVSNHHGINLYQGISGTIQDRLSSLGGAFEYYFKGARNANDGFRGNSESRITSFDIKTAYVLPEESGKFYINAKRTHDSVSNPGELTLAQFQASRKQTNKPMDYQKFTDTVVQIGADKKFWDDKVTTSIMTNWRRLQRDAFTTFATFNDCDSLPPFDAACVDAFPNTDFVQSKARNNDLIWQLSYDDQWDWLGNHSLIGMEFRKGTDFSTQFNAPRTMIDFSDASTDRIAHSHNRAIFWQERLGLTKYVDVNVGMRHDLYGLQTENKETPRDSYSKKWLSSVLNTGVTLHPHESTDIFFNYAQGFRVPDISDINAFGFAAPNVGLRPETSDSYEIGSRYRFRDLFKLRASWFLTDMEDEIVYVSDPITFAGQNLNASKTRRQGIEAGIDIHPLREVALFGNYTLTNAYIRETGGSSFVDGRTLGQIPEHRMTWGLELTPLQRLGEYFEGLKLRMDGSFTGMQHPSGYESTSRAVLTAGGGAAHTIKSYTLWNFLISYALKNQEIYFKINNVFDNKYYSRAFAGTSDTTPIYGAGTYTFVNSGAPREYLVGMRWEIE